MARTIPKKYIPTIESKLRKRQINVPPEIYEASGIRIFGKRIKSLMFSTDVALIQNCNADGIIAVYPFTPQTSITRAIIDVSPKPVFAGVGGGLTTGQRSVAIALDAELYGAYGVVLNAPASNELITQISHVIDIPIVITVLSEYEDVLGRLKAGAHIFNVSGGKKTAAIVKKIRDLDPYVPIIATGGDTPEHVLATIEAGANTLTFTPPSSGQIFTKVMNDYRQELFEKQKKE